MPLAAALDSDISQIDNTRQEFIVDGVLTPSGSYPTNGDTLDLSALGVPSDSLPVKVEIYEATTAANKPAYGGVFLFLPGSTLANGIMEIFNGTTQITTDTYVNILGASKVLRFRAWFKSFR